MAEFGNDTGGAQAMREFLRYAAENWQPTPRYLLLAGDAASPSAAQPDAPNRNLLPTHLVSQGSSQAADDGWFVTFDDSGPQMTVGRLPVQTAEELTTVVAKTIAYETAVSQTPNAAWLRRALLIADDKPYFDMAQDQLEDSLYQNGYHIHDLHMSQNQDIYFQHCHRLKSRRGDSQLHRAWQRKQFWRWRGFYR
ncbi:MAG: C25 family cysteine peptidase [Chloroflexi bacterium]|nr:C25 family cysteine peptidase [Chloroflexota bacterium]